MSGQLYNQLTFPYAKFPGQVEYCDVEATELMGSTKRVGSEESLAKLAHADHGSGSIEMERLAKPANQPHVSSSRRHLGVFSERERLSARPAKVLWKLYEGL